MHLVLALNAELPQEWVVDATARFATSTGATVAVVCVDEVQLERLAPVPRSVYVGRAEEAASGAVQGPPAAGARGAGAAGGAGSGAPQRLRRAGRGGGVRSRAAAAGRGRPGDGDGAERPGP